MLIKHRKLGVGKMALISDKWSFNFLAHLWVCSTGVNVFLRKIAVAAASKPAVEITQQGESLSIQTSTSVRTTHVSFTVGESFNEATVDGRPCTVIPPIHPSSLYQSIIPYIIFFSLEIAQAHKTEMYYNIYYHI